MSAMLPNESPATRYCYTCATAAGSTKLQLDAQSGSPPEANPDDLELQPAEETSSSSSKPRGRIPQIAPSRSGARNVRPPTAVPNIRPSARGSSRVAIPVPQPSGSAPSIPAAASGSRNRISSPRFEIPQIAPRAEDFQPDKQSPAFPLKIALGLCACVMLALAALYATKGSKEIPPAGTSVANALPVPAVTTKSSVEIPKVSTAKALVPTDKKPEPKPVTPSNDLGAHIGLAVPADPKNAPPGIPPPAPANTVQAAPKPSTAIEINDILSKPSLKKSTPVEEEEATPVIAAKPKATAKPEIPAPDANPANPPAAPDKADKADEDDELGKDGKPKKPKRSLLENLGGEAPAPVKHEVEKKDKENPFAIKTVPVTATEPTILPLDIEKVGGTDRTLTEQMIAFLPNWRIRDANFNGCKIGEKHQGRDNVIVLNPLNDVLPAKLMATIEIPKNFAGARPTILFEIASAVNGKDWALGVKAMGVDMFPRTKVKMPKDAPWREVAIDLTPLADKHFDFQIEVNATGKHPKGTASEIGYIRNVRFEWKGKKKQTEAEAAKPPQPKPEDKPDGAATPPAGPVENVPPKN